MAPRAAGPGSDDHSDVAYLYNPRPDYPAAARRLHLQGNVVLRVLVTASGQPDRISVAQSSGASLLDEAALAKVRTWRFTPAQHDGEALAHWVEIPIRFRLEN